MQFNQITYFLRTCDTLNFTRAAEICHVSQPSLSAAIQKLENELGGELFERKGKTVQLTPLGESMRVHLSRIEAARIAASFAATELVENRATVIHVGFMCTLSPTRLLAAIAAFGRKSENAELILHDVWESKVLELLLASAIDCVVMAHTKNLPEQFEAEFLSDDPIVLAMNENHPLAKQKHIIVSDLHGERYIDRLRCEFRGQFFKELGVNEIDVKVALRSEREDLVVSAINNSVGVTIMPKSAAETNGLSTCSIDDLPVVRQISVVTVKNRELNPCVQEFVDELREQYRNTSLS